jgi:hypothetical protein
MRGTKAILAIVALAALVAVSSVANAQGVKFLGVGSSAMFTGSGVASFNDICSTRTGSDCHHYSIKGKNANDGNNFAQAVDSRNASIPAEGGNLWVVWDNATSPVTVWGYLTVDTIVGDRLFFATPRGQLQVDSGVLTTAGMNLIASNLFFNAQTGLNQADDASLPSSVLTVIQTTFTAALSDIRPDDAKGATNRILAAYNGTSLNGLGYGVTSANCPSATSLIGCPILGSWGGSKATPVQFNLSGGKDPFTGLTVPKSTVIPYGAAPIVFVYNDTNPSGLGAGGFTDWSFTTATQFYEGKKGLVQDLPGALGTGPLNVILREPLSGTYTTTEWNTFRVQLAPKYLPAKDSQEKGVDLSQGTCPGLGCPNPLQLAGADGGVRLRGIGTGQVISGNSNVGGVKNLADSIGYTFFSYGNVAPIAAVAKYVTLDGVDPLNSSYTDGTIPTCTAPCPVTPGTSFPHLRDGSYRTWSILRVVTDASGSNLTNAQAIVTSTQKLVNSIVPDFVPAVATPDGDPGMPYYKSHFKVAGGGTKGTISNGNPGQGKENGGDVGGCPFQIATQPAQYCWRLNGTPAKTSEPVPCNYPLNQRTTCDLSPNH